MTTDSWRSAVPVTAVLVSQLRHASLLHGVSSYVLHSSAFVGFVTGCKH